MAHVIVKGGTFMIADKYFPEGVTECSDETVLEAIRRDPLPWVRVSDNYVQPSPAPSPAEEPQPALPTTGQLAIALTTEDLTPKTAAARIAEAEAPPPAPVKAGFPCEHCDKNLKSEGARFQHTKFKHPERLDEYEAAKG